MRLDTIDTITETCHMMYVLIFFLRSYLIDILHVLCRPQNKGVHLRSVIPVLQANQIGGRVVKNITRMIYKRCIFLSVKSKQHVSAIYGHHQVLCQLRFHYINCVKCVMVWRSPHRIIVEIYPCIGRYYARMICSVPLVVQGSHPGVCRVSSSSQTPHDYTLYTPPGPPVTATWWQNIHTHFQDLLNRLISNNCNRTHTENLHKKRIMTYYQNYKK